MKRRNAVCSQQTAVCPEAWGLNRIQADDQPLSPIERATALKTDRGGVASILALFAWNLLRYSLDDGQVRGLVSDGGTDSQLLTLSSLTADC